MNRVNRRSGLHEESLQNLLESQAAEAQRRQEAINRQRREEQERKQRQEFLKQKEEAEKQELERKLEEARKEKAKLEAKAAARRQVEENTRIRQEYFAQKEREEREAKRRLETQQKLLEKADKAAEAATGEDKPLRSPRISIFQVAETGERGNYYYLTKKQAKLMDKAAIREALNHRRSENDKLSAEERQAAKEAWFSSLSFEKFSNSQKPDHKFAKYHRPSGWRIKDEPPFNASSLIRKHEIRMCHYIFEFVNYRGIKRRFKEAYDAGLIDPQRLDILMVFTMKIVGGKLVKFIRHMFVRCFHDHNIQLPGINIEAAPSADY
ncbi:Oidioi.mRNA.OKI2018_I69.PAR.g11280.t1.cds [Oikopleura dioica]|uniref:Oidioi.mRNA.OKI2018_I69.PAR.g11280.t1.cds n=1 Tax=Oikopleura dioica TaxID=34765 RepID=A0ABN7RY37_OIKDI|nr:Oidioi.mRNA.OKI2018_I69.PAR.g11280.t1.cds [Oikopleura dioica]